MEPDHEPPQNLGTIRAIGQSWLSMKTWVKMWLFFLNGVFLVSLYFWPRNEVKWILLAYIASAPLLFGFMVYQRGLTRLLGLAHLIPWTPLLIYLTIRLESGLTVTTTSTRMDATFYGYLVTLTACLVVCLALDLIDVIRWINGERYVLGTEEAARSNASKLTLQT